jgi:hypothetical protein
MAAADVVDVKRSPLSLPVTVGVGCGGAGAVRPPANNRMKSRPMKKARLKYHDMGDEGDAVEGEEARRPPRLLQLGGPRAPRRWRFCRSRPLKPSHRWRSYLAERAHWRSAKARQVRRAERQDSGSRVCDEESLQRGSQVKWAEGIDRNEARLTESEARPSRGIWK